MKKKILVGMSGGVDSAVAAHLLQEQGYEVVAGFMKNYADPSNPDCHTRKDRDMALQVSQHLGITTFIIFDFRKEYHQSIIQYIYDTYKQGLTPNPDILCNTLVKFKLFLERAKELGCDGVATGHYARVSSNGNTYSLLKGIDKNKDQSYFLSGLDQKQLSYSHFPLGHLTKPQVRDIAREINLPNAERKDSQGLCFIGKVSMKEFLQEALPIQHGEIVDEDGNVLGIHDGIWFYTIGQRQGLGLAGGPWYVLQRDIDANILTVGPASSSRLYTKSIMVKQWHRIHTEPSLPYPAQGKIRYRQLDQACTVHTTDISGVLRVDFEEEQRASSPGQTIAIYEGDILRGSGIIC